MREEADRALLIRRPDLILVDIQVVHISPHRPMYRHRLNRAQCVSSLLEPDNLLIEPSPGSGSSLTRTSSLLEPGDTIHRAYSSFSILWRIWLHQDENIDKSIA